MLPSCSRAGSRSDDAALGESDFPAIAARLRTDPALRFETSAEIVDGRRVGAGSAPRPAQDDWFPHYDIAAVRDRADQPVDAEGAAMAYYRPPAVDGSRPGAHCLLATHPAERFRFEYEALAFHESVPGHHLQLATARQLDLPRYRRHLDVEACSFNEGWGLYAERLAEEMGLYSGDVALLGMLSFAALRACRLVIDTGMHPSAGRASRPWSSCSGTPRPPASTSAARSTATSAGPARRWPTRSASGRSSGCASARAPPLGDRFDLRAFHGAVLGSGALPLARARPEHRPLDRACRRDRRPREKEASAWT